MGKTLQKSATIVIAIALMGILIPSLAIAQDASPTPTVTASPSTSPTASPSSSPSATPSVQPGTGSNEPISSATASPKVDKKKVLGTTTKLGSTSAGKEIAKWIFGGLVGVGVIIYGLKITRSNAES